MKVPFIIYVCPTEGCGNYYGSTNMADMETVQTDKHMQPTFPRKRCPDCWQRSKEMVMRVPVRMEADVG